MLSRDGWVEGTNLGTVRWRKSCGTSRKESLADKLHAIRTGRQKVLHDTYKGNRTYIPHKKQSVDRYKEAHNGRSPQDDGLTPTMLLIDNKMQLGVMIRACPEGENDCDVEMGDRISTQTTLMESEEVLREGQLDATFEYHAGDVTDAVLANAVSCALADDSTDEDDDNKTPDGSQVGEDDEEKQLQQPAAAASNLLVGAPRLRLIGSAPAQQAQNAPRPASSANQIGAQPSRAGAVQRQRAGGAATLPPRLAPPNTRSAACRPANATVSPSTPALAKSRSSSGASGAPPTPTYAETLLADPDWDQKALEKVCFAKLKDDLENLETSFETEGGAMDTLLLDPPDVKAANETVLALKNNATAVLKAYTEALVNVRRRKGCGVNNEAKLKVEAGQTAATLYVRAFTSFLASSSQSTVVETNLAAIHERGRRIPVCFRARCVRILGADMTKALRFDELADIIAGPTDTHNAWMDVATACEVSAVTTRIGSFVAMMIEQTLLQLTPHSGKKQKASADLVSVCSSMLKAILANGKLSHRLFTDDLLQLQELACVLELHEGTLAEDVMDKKNAALKHLNELPESALLYTWLQSPPAKGMISLIIESIDEATSIWSKREPLAAAQRIKHKLDAAAVDGKIQITRFPHNTINEFSSAMCKTSVYIDSIASKSPDVVAFKQLGVFACDVAVDVLGEVMSIFLASVNGLSGDEASVESAQRMSNELASNIDTCRLSPNLYTRRIASHDPAP